MFEIGILQNAKYDNLIGFPKSGHIYSYIIYYIISYIKEFCMGGSKAKTVLYCSYSTVRCEQC